MQTITLIDEDPNIHRAILPALRERFPEAIIHSCLDGAVGWELIQSQPPDVVIFDLCLPSLDGLDLFLRVKNSLPRTHVILTSANRLVLESLARKFAGEMPLTTIAKPFLTGSLIDHVVEALYGPQISSLRDVGLASVLQLLALEGKNCWLDVYAAGKRGTCRMMRGDIVYAVCGHHQGIDAMHAMMRFHAPVFTVFADDGEASTPRNVFARFNELILLCCTAFDEGMQVA